MNSINNNDAGARIFENLEALSEKELLELSTQIDILQKPSAESALDAFKKDYLPEASEVSLYDIEKEAVRVKRINLKTLLIAAVVVVMIVASSIVSYAAGAASGEAGLKQSNSEQNEEPLRTTTTIDGKTGELFIVRPIEDFDFESYKPKQGTIGRVGDPYIYNTYHFVDEDGNILEFEKLKITDEMSEEANKKSVEKFGEEASGYQAGDIVGVTERSFITHSVNKAGEYYCETLEGFTHDHSKAFAYIDTNFQVESTITIYAYCYNAELNIYKEFLTSRTYMGGFDISFEPPEGWQIIESEIIISNALVGRKYTVYKGEKNSIEASEDLAAFRQKLNEALEKYQKEKEEKNEIIGKIESGLNK